MTQSWGKRYSSDGQESRSIVLCVMAGLKAGRFTGGPLIVECLARGDLAQTLAEAKKARAFVERLV